MDYKLITPKQAKMLYALDFIKDSEKMYQKLKDGDSFFYRVESTVNACHPMSKSVAIETLPAYDVAELGTFLPPFLVIDNSYHILVHSHDTISHYVSYYELIEDLNDNGIIKYVGSGETEAQSRASLLIDLIQKNILK
jgi:hypothetical protein